MADAFALAIYSGIIIFDICKAAKPAGLAALRFHGKGRIGKRHLICAGSLRERSRGSVERTISVKAIECGRYFCRKRIYPFRRQTASAGRQAERMNAFPTPKRRASLIYRYNPQENGPYYPSKRGAGEFSTHKMDADCASCTENALFDKTEKIKKKIRSFF